MVEWESKGVTNNKREGLPRGNSAYTYNSSIFPFCLPVCFPLFGVGGNGEVKSDYGKRFPV